MGYLSININMIDRSDQSTTFRFQERFWRSRRSTAKRIHSTRSDRGTTRSERRDRVIGHLELALPTAAARGRALKSAGYAFREQLHRDVSSVRRPETAGPGAGCIREWKIEGVGGGAG